jgi:hypothetical protein
VSPLWCARKTSSAGSQKVVRRFACTESAQEPLMPESPAQYDVLGSHFPTRDALIEAVYRTEVEKLAAAQKKFSESLPPIEALRPWMLLFVDYIATKQIIGSALS